MKVRLTHWMLVFGVLLTPVLGHSSVDLSPSYIEWDVTAGSGADDGELLLGGRFRTIANWDFVNLDLNVPLYFTRAGESESLEWRNTNRAAAIVSWFDRLEIEPPHQGWRAALERAEPLRLGSGALVQRFTPLGGVLGGSTRVAADLRVPGAEFSLRSGEITRGQEWFAHVESRPFTYLNLDRSQRMSMSMTVAHDIDEDLSAFSLGARLKLFQNETQSFALVGDLATASSGRGDGLHAGFSYEGKSRIGWSWVTQAVLAGENYRPGLWDEGYELEVGDRRQSWSSTTSDAQLWVVSALHLNLNGFALEWHLDVPTKDQSFENTLGVSVQFETWSAATRWTHRALGERGDLIAKDGRVFGLVEGRWLVHDQFYIGASWQRTWEEVGQSNPELIDLGILMVGLTGHHDG